MGDHIGLDMRMKNQLLTKLDMLTSLILLVSWFGLSIPTISEENGIKRNSLFYILSNPKCSGTAPMCDVEPSTTTTTTTTTIPVTSPTTSSPFDPSQCTEVNDVIPYPGDCHRYLMCLDNGQGGYNLQVYTCGDWVFDPNIDACTDPGLPSNDLICG